MIMVTIMFIIFIIIDSLLQLLLLQVTFDISEQPVFTQRYKEHIIPNKIKNKK